MDADGEAIQTFSQAQAKARMLAVTLDPHRGPADSTGSYTVAKCLEEYLFWMGENRKSGTDARYRANTHIFPHLGAKRCDQLSTRAIQGWLTNMSNAPARIRTRKDQDQKHKISPDNLEAKRRRRASANRTLTILKAALNRAWRSGKISSDHAWRRVEPFEGADAARVRYLSITEAQQLIKASDLDFRNLVRAALATGARYGELAALTVADFNPDSNSNSSASIDN